MLRAGSLSHYALRPIPAEGVWPCNFAQAYGIITTLIIRGCSASVCRYFPLSGQRVYAIIRPEEVHIIRPDRPLGPKVRENLFAARIERRVPTPGGYVLTASVQGLKSPVEIHLSNCAFDDLNLTRDQGTCSSLRCLMR